jgi:hypothetical protein
MCGETMDDNEAVNGEWSNGRGPMIFSFPLEIEHEEDSLIHETGDFSGVVSKLTKRKRFRFRDVLQQPSANMSTGFRGLLRHPTAFRVRNAIFVAGLACMVFLFIDKMANTVNSIEEHNMVDEDPRGIHQSSFGGLSNTGHPAGAKAHQQHEEELLHDWDLPVSNVGHGVISVTRENLINHNGHYWHDPYQCPFASHLYNRTDEERQEEQDAFDATMKVTKKTWGAWTLVDPFYDSHNKKYRPKANFSRTKHRDMDLADFPTHSWQMDKEYVAKFIDEAKKMVERVKEGIYAEYGHPTTAGTTYLTGDALRNRDALFQVILDDFKVINGQAVDDATQKPKQGIAYLSRTAWEALVQKLLHSLITNDFFFVVMAGDGAAAGHGNNFMQSSIMQFHYLMEPVFDFFGMRLISRNMAMNDPTTFSALAGADIYGEADIMWYSGKPESAGQHDLFHKQAILSGERVPILLTPSPGTIEHDSDGAAWVGNLQPGPTSPQSEPGICPWMNDAAQVVAPACELVYCDKGQEWCREAYNSVCWVDRIKVAPPIAQDSTIDQAGNPGPLAHKLEGRMLSMLVLHALDEALDKWVNGIEKDGFPLMEDYWHVGTSYNEVRESVRTHVPREDEEPPACDQLFAAFPIVCRVEMHAFSEWTPRVNPDSSGLSQILFPKMDSLNFEVEPLYEGIDVLPLQWKVPAGQVDVHAIAISTTALPPLNEKDDGTIMFDDMLYEDDASWLNNEDDLNDLNHGDDEDPGDRGGIRRVSQKERRLPQTVGDGTGPKGAFRFAAESSNVVTTAPSGAPEMTSAPSAAPQTTTAPTSVAPETTTAPSAAPMETPSPAQAEAAAQEAAAQAAKAKAEAEAAQKAQEDAEAEEQKAAQAKKEAEEKAQEAALAAQEAEKKEQEKAAQEAEAAKKMADEAAEAEKKAAQAKQKAAEEAQAAEAKAQEEKKKAAAEEVAIAEAKAAARGETIAPGLGWTVQSPIAGFCDGSAQSTCNRSSKNTCLLAGHNDFHSGILGDALSGWLMLRLDNVKEGVILARFDTTVPPDGDATTDGWTKVNQGNLRRLNIPGDFMFDYAINGNITSLSRTEFLDFGTVVFEGMTLYPLLLNKTLSHQERDEWEAGETIDVAIRIRSGFGREATILLSHLYYA